jgi:hypothetical protein
MSVVRNRWNPKKGRKGQKADETEYFNDHIKIMIRFSREILDAVQSKISCVSNAFFASVFFFLRV